MKKINHLQSLTLLSKKTIELDRGFLYLLILVNALQVHGQSYWNSLQIMPSQDNFEIELCRERWSRLDWQYIIRPCVGRTKFGVGALPSTLATNPNMSRIGNMDIRNAGEYSKLTIQSVTQFGMMKTIGGDTWRVLITGPTSVQPIVHDLGNGVYEIPFLIMEPGLYQADIYLEGTLCSQFLDPPTDWFVKGDYNGHFQEAHMYKDHPGWPYLLRKRIWNKLGGSQTLVQFQILPQDRTRYQANMAKLSNWKNVCKIPEKCDFIWDGFGRWAGMQWKPYDESEGMADEPEDVSTAKRKKEGVLQFYGDCYAHHFYEMEWNKTLCTDIFKECTESYNWVYPRLHPVHELDPSIHRKDPSDISIDKIVSLLRKAMETPRMDEKSAIIVNYGLHLTRSTSFENYKKLISEVIKAFKDYEGQAIWRTTTSAWKLQDKVHKRFQTNQRIQLFNAYAVSSMCEAGIPILDVYPITASTSFQPKDGIHYENSITRPIENVLINHFRDDDV